MLREPWQTNAWVQSAYEAAREKDRPRARGTRSRTAVPALPPARRAACLPMCPSPCVISMRLCLVGWEGGERTPPGDWVSRSSSSVGPPSARGRLPCCAPGTSGSLSPLGPPLLTATPCTALLSPPSPVKDAEGPAAQRCSDRALRAGGRSSRPLEIGEEAPGTVSALGWG